MFELKKLTREGIEGALERVDRYRLLNQPEEAESICLDVLEIDPENQRALVGLILALADQFDSSRPPPVREVEELVPRLERPYERAYYAGIICERRGAALLKRGSPGSQPIVFDWYRKAMEHFEEAEKVRPEGNDDARIRWNTCARIIARHNLRPAAPVRDRTFLE